MKLRRTLIQLIWTTALLMVLASYFLGGCTWAKAGTGNSLKVNATASIKAKTACTHCSDRSFEHFLDSQFQYSSGYACLAEAVASPILYIKRTVSIDKNDVVGSPDGVTFAWRSVLGSGPYLQSQDSPTLCALSIRLQV